ncbi:peptidylprolyl isomerase [Streptomyces sp. ME19-01-6]|uniref:peptidylprolyl isomerase n=1 Tax=Streptomyces sp. ME19-01-6 TaxID=3028686 RepID=UPI0029BAC870|nr:peptidylprolyl isomerase [Streptomyces sp. ME19-01-6]MDX3228606.1 peptidylprolyl isomerase [Streptomyces sp. ME19-01-6]
MVSNEQRRRQLAREKYLRQQHRRESARQKQRRRYVVIASTLAVVLAAGGVVTAVSALSGGDDKKSDKADKATTPTMPTPTPTPTTKAPDPCAKGAKEAGNKKPKTMTWKKEPAVTIDKSASYAMKLETTCGDMTVTMDAAKAPHTVNSFSFLAGKGYFDHTKCHRLTTQGIFVLQCGDPMGNGMGGPGYTIPDENLKDSSIKGNKYPAGTVAMANQYDPTTKKGKNSGGSQFFLVYKDSELPPYYTPFGTLDKDSMQVLKKIADGGAQAPDPQTGNTAPNATVVINKATVGKS